MVGVDVGVVRFLRLRVERGEVVFRVDSPGRVCGGVASCRGWSVAVVKRCAWGRVLPLGVLVYVHASSPRGGPCRP